MTFKVPRDQKLVVANPHNCVVGCSNCAPRCPVEAITFPPLSVLKQYR
ncbi:MAG: ferredoxin family protein [Firmicutes bacterium]|nr:ferredoxin family protein [Bacillota bacterium]